MQFQSDLIMALLAAWRAAVKGRVRFEADEDGARIVSQNGIMLQKVYPKYD